MSEQNIITPFDHAFTHNVALRPCNFNPGENFETYVDENGVVKHILGLSYKLLWFHSYCDSTKVTGRVESDDYTVMIFESVGTGMVSAKARIFIDDKCVATGSASKGFILNQPMSMDGAIQSATGSALSRALGNAGFGSIATYEPGVINPPAPSSGNDELPFTGPEPGNPLVESATAAPAAAPAGPGNQANMGASQQTGFFGYENTPQQVANMPNKAVTAAKAAIWPCGGLNAGKPLGDILATNPKDIIWLAETYKKACPAKEAAILLLPEAKKLCGK